MSNKKGYKKIYLCSSDSNSENLARNLGSYYGIEAVKLTDDPRLLRETLADTNNDCLVVIDSVQSEMDPRNIAQAMLSDGYKVVLLYEQDVEDENVYANISSSGNLELLKRFEIATHEETKIEKPLKNIEIPEDEYQWDSLRTKLQNMASKAGKGINAAFDELDEVEGVSSRKGESHSTTPIPSLVFDKNSQRGRSIAFCSGRGGVRKTTLISTAGMIAASWGLKVALLDLDLFCGNLYMHFGEPSIASVTSIRNVDGNVDKLVKDYMQKVSKNTDLYLYGALDHSEEAELVTPYYEFILNALLQKFDLVLIDMPTTWNEQDVRILRQVDRMIVVADERASSVSSMIRTMNLANRLGIVRTKMIRLINRCDSYGFDQKFIKKAEEGSYCPHTFYVEDGGTQVSQMLSEGKAVQLIQMRNACIKTWSKTLKAILSDIGITIANEEKSQKSRSLLASLFSNFQSKDTAIVGEV